MAVALQQEYDYFLAHRENFVKSHLNEFVLIKGDQVVSFYDTYDNALHAGLLQFGNVPFFIEQVNKEETVYYFHQGIN